MVFNNDYFTCNFIGYFLIVNMIRIFYSWQNKYSLVPAASIGEISYTDCMFFASSEEKTEPATPHRRHEARKKGQVARSSDLNAAIVLLAIIVLIYALRDYLGVNIVGYVQHILSQEMTSTINSDQIFDIYRLTLYLCFKIMAPILVIAILFGLAANFLQVGFIFASEAVEPKLSNIDPIEGLKKIFSKRALFDFLKTLLKILVIGLVIYYLVKNDLPNLLQLINMDTGRTIDYLEKIIYKICITSCLAFLIIAALDFAYQKWQFSQTLKMSKYEIKKEMKQTEGDPLIKAKLREKQRLIAMRRMMQSVPEATVVITNPTHLAVALKYDDKVMQAPQIIAKGADHIAVRIKEKAVENKIPIYEDKPLARSLYKGSEIGDYVPVELYHAVASVLAAIYSLKRNRGAGNGED